MSSAVGESVMVPEVARAERRGRAGIALEEAPLGLGVVGVGAAEVVAEAGRIARLQGDALVDLIVEAGQVGVGQLLDAAIRRHAPPTVDDQADAQPESEPTEPTHIHSPSNARARVRVTVCLRRIWVKPRGPCNIALKARAVQAGVQELDTPVSGSYRSGRQEPTLTSLEEAAQERPSFWFLVRTAAALLRP